MILRLRGSTMSIDQLLNVKNWKDNPLEVMGQLLGDRESTVETELVRRIMQKTVCYSAKTWKRNVAKYDAFDIHQEISSREKPLRILDVGCGDASVLSELKQTYQEAIECYGTSVMEHPHLGNVNYYICPAEIMPLEWNGFFDIVFTHQAFRYILNPNSALDECVRVLKGGGLFGGYIGTEDTGKSLFYNPSLPHRLSVEAQRTFSLNRERFNSDFLQVLLALPTGFIANVSYDEKHFPHKIYLIKGGNEKIVR